MKLITAIIRPEKLNLVRESLAAEEIYRITVSDVRGAGQEIGREEVYRGQSYTEELVPKVRVSLAVNDDFVEKVVDIIVQAARTGHVGDGKIFIQPLETCIRIRTGEQSNAAIG